ncbi:MAG TPA: cobalamin-dependent protein [Anaerolineales bacterium]
MTLSRVPIYNLGVVLKETGLAADTLRAWERRYGLPKPGRSPGRHRLYSERDILLIKWLQSRQAEGMTISRAVQRWKDLAAAGGDPLEEQRTDALARGRQPGSYANLDSLREDWLAACLQYDEAAAEQILNLAYGQYSVEVATSEVIERALHEVGEMWLRGEASVQQEHFLSALTTRRLDALISASPPPVLPQALVLACAQGESHSLPILYLNLLLRRRGHKVVFLGADVPIERIAETAQAVKAALVVLSAEQLVTAATLRDEAVLLAKRRVPVAYGGRIFVQEPDLQKQITGTYLGDEIGTAATRIEGLLQEPPLARPRTLPGPALEARAFDEVRPRLERHVYQHFSNAPLPSRLLDLANKHFGAALSAALELGNMKYLEVDVDWIHTVLAGQGLPADSLRAYLLTYADAIRKVMGTSGAEIAGWLRSYASRM